MFVCFKHFISYVGRYQLKGNIMILCSLNSYRLMQVTFTYADTKPVVTMESNTVTDSYIYYVSCNILLNIPMFNSFPGFTN